MGTVRQAACLSRVVNVMRSATDGPPIVRSLIQMREALAIAFVKLLKLFRRARVANKLM